MEENVSRRAQREEISTDREPWENRKWRTVVLVMLIGFGAFVGVAWAILTFFVDHPETSGDTTTGAAAPSWTQMFADIDRVVVSGNVAAVQNGDNVSLVDLETGDRLGTLGVVSADVRVAATHNTLVSFTDEEVAIWNVATGEESTTSVDDGQQVRVLGDMVFTISEDQKDITWIRNDATAESLDKPSATAVPIHGTSNGDIVWATSDTKVITTNAEGQLISETTLKAPVKESSVSRWLGASNTTAAVIWTLKDEHYLVAHHLESGQILSQAPIDEPSQKLWRVTQDRNLATIADLVVDLGNGALMEFVDEVEHVVPLKRSFVGVQDGQGIRFDTATVEEHDRELVETVKAERSDGALVVATPSDEGVALTVQPVE